MQALFSLHAPLLNNIRIVNHAHFNFNFSFTSLLLEKEKQRYLISSHKTSIINLTITVDNSGIFDFRFDFCMTKKNKKIDNRCFISYHVMLFDDECKNSRFQFKQASR